MMAQKPRQSLTLGDALAVIALLMFAVGWVVMWSMTTDDGDIQRLHGTAALIVALLVFGPPLAALSAALHIVRGDR